MLTLTHNKRQNCLHYVDKLTTRGGKQAHSQLSQDGTNDLSKQHIGTGISRVPMTLQVHVFEWV